MKRVTIALVVISMLTAGSAVAGNSFGVRGGLIQDDDTNFHLGGHLKGIELTPEVGLAPNIEIGFYEFGKIYAFNGDVVYPFKMTDISGYTPYLGGEIGLMMISPDGGDSETRIGISLLAGLEKTLDAQKALMFELKLGLSDYAPDIKLTAGLSFF